MVCLFVKRLPCVPSSSKIRENAENCFLQRPPSSGIYLLSIFNPSRIPSIVGARLEDDCLRPPFRLSFAGTIHRLPLAEGTSSIGITNEVLQKSPTCEKGNRTFDLTSRSKEISVISLERNPPSFRTGVQQVSA